MIKRVFITALFVLATSLASFADEQKKITLNNKDHTSEIIELAYCNIFVSLKGVDSNDNAKITIELENVNESNNTLILFERAYDEKALKKMSPSITYDKVFGGSKGERYIDVCPDLKFTNKIKYSEKATLFVKAGTPNSKITCKLPIYFAKNKSGSKMVLLEKDVIEIEIMVDVQSKSDEDFIRIENEYKAISQELKDLTFCLCKKHKEGSIKGIKSKSKYEERIKKIQEEIDSVVKERGYFPSDDPCKQFTEIHDKLDKIRFVTVSICKNCQRPPTHTCKICSLSYEQIYNKLQNYYIDIHNRKKTKAQVMSEVESLYTCVSKNTKRPANNSIKSRITKYYNKIKSL